MIPVKHIDPDDLALYAMQLLPPEEMEEMTLNLQHSVEARRVLAEFLGDLSIFAHTAEMQSAPPLALQRLMKHVAREKKVVPQHLLDPMASGAYAPRPVPAVADEEPVKKTVASKVIPWIGWALAAGLAVEVANLAQDRQHLQENVASARGELAQTVVSAELANTLMETVKDPNAQHVLLVGATAKPVPEGRASYVADKGSLIFLASNLEPLEPTKTYELWLIPQAGSPIAAGTFKPDDQGNASVVLPRLPKGIAAKAFGVTVEEGDGGSSPTMPIILKGAPS